MDSLTRLLNSASGVRRGAAVALAVAVVGGAVAVGVAAVASVASHAESVHDKRQQLGRLQAVLSLKPALAAAHSSDGAEAERSEFLRGSNPALVQAELQAWLGLMAETHEVKLQSVGNAPPLEQEGMRYAGLRANVSGTNEAIQGLIYEIETTRPYLIIRQAQLHSTLTSQQGPRRGPEELVLQVQFYGALPPDTASADGGTGAVR